MPSQNKLQTQECPIEIWQEFVDTDPTATFFQTPKWYTLAGDFLGLTPSTKYFIQGSEQAVLPLLKKRKVFTHYVSPLGTYTGLLSPKKLSEDFKQSIVNYLNKNNVYFYDNPFSVNQITLKSNSILPTYTVPLSDDNLEPNPKKWRRGHRNSLRIAKKKDCQIRQGTTIKDVEKYYSIYQSTYERWKEKPSLPYSKEFLAKLINECKPQNTAKLWLCEVEGKIIAGMICFYFKDHVVAWHGSTNSEYFNYYPNQFLLYHIFYDAKLRGFKSVDLNPSKGLEGVKNFKLGFGAVETEAFLNSSTSLTYGWMKKLKDRLP